MSNFQHVTNKSNNRAIVRFAFLPSLRAIAHQITLLTSSQIIFQALKDNKLSPKYTFSENDDFLKPPEQNHCDACSRIRATTKSVSYESDNSSGGLSSINNFE